MATHASILSWKIPWIAEPGDLQPMELQRVRHDRMNPLVILVSPTSFLSAAHLILSNLYPSPDISSELQTPRTAAAQVPLSMEFHRQEYWSSLPFPPPGDLPNPGIEPICPALAGGFFTSELPEKPPQNTLAPN